MIAQFWVFSVLGKHDAIASVVQELFGWTHYSRNRHG
jgi:hypothetical protein